MEHLQSTYRPDCIVRLWEELLYRTKAQPIISCYRLLEVVGSPSKGERTKSLLQWVQRTKHKPQFITQTSLHHITC